MGTLPRQANVHVHDTSGACPHGESPLLQYGSYALGVIALQRGRILWSFRNSTGI